MLVPRWSDGMATFSEEGYCLHFAVTEAQWVLPAGMPYPQNLETAKQVEGVVSAGP